MDMTFTGFPPQQLPFKSKGPKWRRQVMDYADSKGSIVNFSPVRRSVSHKKINYDLYNLKIHKEDIQYVLNPYKQKASFIPDNLQHYPVMNPLLRVLQGEAQARVFDYHVVVTNPTAISEIENTKRDAVFQQLQQLIQSTSVSEEDFNRRLTEMDDYFSYQYQDMREQRANELLKHYEKEYDFHTLFDNNGFMDALIVGEEMYQCDIIGGEPVIERLNPMKVRVFRNGYSNRVEDADIIILEDYWSVGRIFDTFYDVLTPKDREYLEKALQKTGWGETDNFGNYDERFNYISDVQMGDMMVQDEHFFSALKNDSYIDSNIPYDTEGNFRVLRVYWKSRRKIKKVKSYNPQTGEEEYNFYPETYIIDKTKGEEEQVYWVNEAWEGTKIGKDIYVNIRPRPIQYNRISNPSRCHFGIIGQIYNINEEKPVSMVDILKPFNYLYDAIHDKLYKLIESNLGKLTTLDKALIPSEWKIDKWLYFAKVNHVALKNSFNEGRKGAATGKLAGALNNNTSGVIDASVGNEIQFQIQLLQYTKQEMEDACGITPQRKGQVSNRETVGGVERATLQSSHITEYVFTSHDNLKKRVLECFLETAKIAMKGRSKKFEYITSEGSRQIMTIDGDEFAECDYGLAVDNGNGTQLLNQKLDGLAQAALQAKLVNFSTMMKLYGTHSISEKVKMIEGAERRMQQIQEEQAQQAQQLQQQQLEAEAQQKQLEMEQENIRNQRDNDTRILVAQIQAQSNIDSSVARASGYTGEIEQPLSEKDRQELEIKIEQLRQKGELEQKKLELEREKIKSQERISKQRKSSS